MPRAAPRPLAPRHISPPIRAGANWAIAAKLMRPIADSRALSVLPALVGSGRLAEALRFVQDSRTRWPDVLDVWERAVRDARIVQIGAKTPALLGDFARLSAAMQALPAPTPSAAFAEGVMRAINTAEHESLNALHDGEASELTLNPTQEQTLRQLETLSAGFATLRKRSDCPCWRPMGCNTLSPGNAACSMSLPARGITRISMPPANS